MFLTKIIEAVRLNECRLIRFLYDTSLDLTRSYKKLFKEHYQISLPILNHYTIDLHVCHPMYNFKELKIFHRIR